jgi:prepilin-type N-terminal cleavage/methylation domain-containing protein
MEKSKNIVNQGFTLIEISTVLLVVSIIVAGILSTSSFIKAARLKSVIAEFQNFQTAANSFKQQYAYWPGDINNATSIWPSGSTANGNGNGLVDYSTLVSNSSTTIEPIIFWQHLSLAGILPNNYNATLNASNYAIIGTSIPASNYQSLDKLGLACWGVNGKYFYLAGLYSNSCGAGCYINSVVPATDAISPVDAYYIDQKIDDSYPSSGSVISTQGLSALTNINCLNGSSYNISNRDRGCLMAFYYF